ncbi:MAG TPA: TRAP transporter TatT component family protein [Polyangia bacterium]|nr:TRAP transporter TatT component family protein [Polyangia bacterium]HWE27610.1 TRAP transporter TatT component family protein [Polyangia bacterium]
MVRLRVLGTLATIFCLAGCDLKAFTVSTTAPVLKVASDSFASENDAQLARDAAPGQLKTVEGFIQSAPNNRDLLHVLAQGYIEYPFGFLEDDLESMPDDLKHAEERKQLTWRATNMYDRALDYALRLIALDDKKFPEQFHKDVASSEAAAKRLDKKDAPGLLFAGLALASAINLNRDDLARVVDLPKAIALIKRSHELDPKFYNAGAAMTLGIVYCSQGKAIGGDPDLGQKFFQEAIDATGGKYLMARVMYARFFGVITQDRPLFEKKLKEVLAEPVDIYPQQRLANTLAKKRAKRYLDHVEDYF